MFQCLLQTIARHYVSQAGRPCSCAGLRIFDGKQIEDHVFHDYEPLIQAWVKHQFWPALRNKVIDMDAIPTRNV
jgi:hypothetical protein